MGKQQESRASGPPLLTIDLDAETSTLVLVGELDISTAPLLEAAIAAHEPAAVDMQAVCFVDSSGLQVLVAAQRHRTETGGARLVVRDPSAVVLRVLALAGLLEHFGDLTTS
jgi:anti-anti-sigma factor